MKQVSVSKSFIDRAELVHTITSEYSLCNARCQLITATMRDVYLITSDSGRNILMIYRHGQRTAAEVAAEWQFLDYLAANDVSVAPAIKTRDGNHVLTFAAPEGTRYGVLSAYAEGEHLRRRPSVEAVYGYGRNIAQIHTLADQMTFPLQRPENNIKTIITQSIAAFEAEVWNRADDLAYLHQCGEILSTKVESLPQEKPVYGFIHGDVIRANALVSEQGKITVIDFDLCGAGWRAYDVASYIYTIRNTPTESEFEQAFLAGYSERISLQAVEKEMLPVFEAVRSIFNIGIQAMNIYHWGSASFFAYLDFHLNQLKKNMDQIA